MKYNILWVDDRKDEFVELDYPTVLKEYVAKLHFEPSIDFFESVEEAKEVIRMAKYDVIFSDYNIGDNDRGDNFIAFIREQNVNTEILFYSALETVPKLNIDRISFFNIPTPNGNPKLLEKMKAMIDLTVEKLADLQIIRGIVMSEVSELDVLMENIIHKYFVESASEERTQLFHKHITTDVEKSVKKKLITKDCQRQCEHKWRGEKIENIISSLEFESSKKAKSIHHIVKNLEIEGFNKESFYSDYEKDIIIMRNNLAHCVSYTNGDKEVLKVKKTGVSDIIFDLEVFESIRANTSKYKSIFNKIYQAL
ncbi:hypothetical protein POY80_18870 [Bacteroides uniformis]|jgi:hypothetical protein|uniref:Response regulator n=1 Tax=Bacteroides uniformis TaxID=820 RepID=A0AAW6G7P0_BACUN|nr:hypothetical protein [Bacteroides uniformis]MDC1754502.1 hypothetical protein [Bacteroides uniformis]MDC1971159.1 hypothetical protein [Bacteroides uniformis]